MKILSIAFSIAFCIGSFGCEMHPASKPAVNGEETPQSSGEETTQSEAVNPNPPSYFPTPNSN
jgi:hypothetical protein